MKSHRRIQRDSSDSANSSPANPLTSRPFAPQPQGDRLPSAQSLQPGWDLTHIPVLDNNTAQGLLQASPALATPTSANDPSFNPYPIVNDLRRAIDSHDTDGVKVQNTPMAGGFLSRTEYIPLRKIDATAVIQKLDNLTAAQIDRIKTLYSSIEGGRTLETDLFGKGATGHESTLKPEQRARIQALLKGTKAETPGEPATDGRLEADAIELHGLLSKDFDDLSESQIERIMALHRRPGEAIDRLDAQYRHHFGKAPNFDSFKGLKRSRLFFLRSGDFTTADACAIEEKRQAIEKLQQDLQTLPADYQQILSEKFAKDKQKLVEGIEAILETTRQEAMASPDKGDKDAAQAVQALLAVPAGEAGKTLGDTLGQTLGTQALSGAIVETTARRLWELETSKTINTSKLAALLRGLRTQAERDVTAQAFDPAITPAEKEAIAANLPGAIDRQAQQYTQAFIDRYNSLRGEGRPYAEIVTSAEGANEDLLNLLTSGAGQLSDVDDLDIAIRKKDKETIKAVLQRQRNQAAVQQLANQYQQKRSVSLRSALFGLFENAEMAALPQSFGALMSGRDAVLAEEALQKPAELGGEAEIRWLASFGQREAKAAEDNSGITGSLREIGDDPETQVIMNESRKKLLALRDEWLNPDPWAGRSRSQILAEMRQLRATLTGDAAAYEADNAQLRGQLTSVLSFAFQAALAIALPGLGVGIVGALALNLSSTVAFNMVALGDQYSLSHLRKDVLGGLVGALGGQLGAKAVGAIAAQVAGKAAQPAATALQQAGMASTLTRETGEAIALATEGGLALKALKEAGEWVGSSTGSTIATGDNAFTLEEMGKSFVLNRLGQLGTPKPDGTPTTTTDAPAKPDELAPPTSINAPESQPHPAIADPAQSAADAPQRPASADPASASPAGPGVRGSVSDRLEARKISNSMEQLGSQWPVLGVDERLSALAAIGNRVLAARGVPHVKFVEDNVGEGAAYFDFKTWTVVVSSKDILRGQLPSDLAASLGGLSRHEVDHTVQWWEMARLQAEQGKDAATIQAEMHIPADIAEHAVAITNHYGPMGPAQRTKAQTWWEQVYGARASSRNYNLAQLEIFAAQLKALDAQILASGANPNPKLLQDRAQIYALWQGFDQTYRNESIERAAYNVQGVVGNEATVMEAERQLDFAEIAVREVNALVNDIEAQLLPILAAEQQPSYDLLHDHLSTLKRLKKVQDQADVLRAKLDALTQQPPTSNP